MANLSMPFANCYLASICFLLQMGNLHSFELFYCSTWVLFLFAIVLPNEGFQDNALKTRKNKRQREHERGQQENCKYDAFVATVLA